MVVLHAAFHAAVHGCTGNLTRVRPPLAFGIL
jgi:hypothetical protein